MAKPGAPGILGAGNRRRARAGRYGAGLATCSPGTGPGPFEDGDRRGAGGRNLAMLAPGAGAVATCSPRTGTGRLRAGAGRVC